MKDILIGVHSKNPRDTRDSLSAMGGLHRSPAGITTLDSQSDEERIEHLRRLNYELGEPLNEPAIRSCYTKAEPKPARSEKLAHAQDEGRPSTPQPEKPSILAQFLKHTQQVEAGGVPW